ncbi:hypothetical protein IFM89_024739 [Coptis chinensis]|uniref:Uncharacterized protein n=1 Tax=Coptis chinensis TaxID=261450 RepID=A0A835H583_9MAGN|nr:hypothetical protein IFM89_024739 [Coptis chinensis]
MFLSRPKTRMISSRHDGDAFRRLHVVRRAENAINCAQGPKEKIREMFNKIELSVSSYDTAWVAMVPSPDSSQQPCFPECLNWLLENQVRDGSWTLPHHHHLLIKESMLSTLACVLALRRWETGDEHVRKGLEFMELNFGLIMDKKHTSPIGFDIIFPGMIEYAKDLDLNLPFSPKFVEAMLHKRDLEFERVSKINSKGSKAYLAYTSEGLTKLCDWKEVMKWQRKNGSMFNSPSTTAATFIQNQDLVLEYLAYS